MEISLTMSLDRASISVGLDGILEKLGDMNEVMASAASAMWASVDANFAAGGRPDVWVPLSENTIKRKGHAIPLYETGRLRSDMEESHGRLHATLTARTQYAGVHQHGSQDIPARPFMLMQPADVAYIRDMVAAHITAA